LYSPTHGVLHIAPVDAAADFPHHGDPLSISLAIAVEVKFQFLAIESDEVSVQLGHVYVIVLRQIGRGSPPGPGLPG
jgi:hypothetical protein